MGKSPLDLCVDYRAGDCLELLIEHIVKNVDRVNMQPVIDALPEICSTYGDLAARLLVGLDGR